LVIKLLQAKIDFFVISRGVFKN